LVHPSRTFPPGACWPAVRELVGWTTAVNVKLLLPPRQSRDPEFGQPGQLAHKVFVALIKKHSDYGRPIQKQVSFTKREIMRMVRRGEWGGKDSEELSRALYEIHHTFIKKHFKTPGGRFIERSFNIFPEILMERREFASDQIEAGALMRAPV
jgi:hypothetical protein